MVRVGASVAGSVHGVAYWDMPERMTSTRRHVVATSSEENSQMSYRILVVEDDGFTRMLLGSQLRELGHHVVGEAANSAEGMASAKVNKPDAIVVDLDLGEGPSGVDFALGARRLQPNVGILLLTSYVDVRLIGDFRPLPPGTVFMVKRSLTNVEAFESAIDMAVESGSRHAFEKLHGDGSLDKLRDGQIEIMRLIACGYTNSEIASQRFLREASVGKAIARLIKQLNLPAGSERNPRVLITQAYFALIAGSAIPRG